MPLARHHSLSAPRQKAAMKPMKNISVPRKPNTCIGFLPKLLRNHNVMRSR